MYTYQIFDSLDRECGEPATSEDALRGDLQALQEEAEEEGDRLTYAILRKADGGDWTTEF